MSGVILFSETVCQHATKEGKNFVELLKEKGIFAGIKVGKVLGVIPGTQDESATLGLDSLANMAAEHYKLGCRFVKWRAVLKIGNGLPPQQAINENAWGLVRYAAICQENGLVPIVEPEILADEDHSIDVCQKVTQKVLAAVFKTLNENNIFLEGFLLKTNLVAPGATNSDRSKVTPQVIGYRTALALSRQNNTQYRQYLFQKYHHIQFNDEIWKQYQNNEQISNYSREFKFELIYILTEFIQIHFIKHISELTLVQYL